MIMDKRKQVTRYVLADLFGSATAWALFYFFRKAYLEPIKYHHPVPLEVDANFWIGLVLIPLFWVGAFLAIGGYSEVFRRFRIKELGQTLVVTLLGSLVIFFVLLLDDEVAGYTYYYRSFVVLFLLNFVLLFSLRFMLTSSTVRKVHGRQIGFNTILVGGSDRAV
ncbi:MAG TPA: hypothetical protein VGE21_15100, partial [Flavobacteriales bacterium]